MGYLATDKHYLDERGTLALIQKIGEFYGEFKSNNDLSTQLYDRVKDLLDSDDYKEFLDVDGVEDIANSKLAGISGKIYNICSYLRDVRADLGTAADAAKADGTAYARIAQLRGEVDQLTADLTALTARVDVLEAAAFTDVKSKISDDGNTLTLGFGTTKTPVGDDLSGATKTIDIDTSRFVVDGMVLAAKIVTIKDDGTVDWPEDTPEGPSRNVPADAAQNHGQNYLVIFLGKSATSMAFPTPVWVPLNELVDDYDFKAEVIADNDGVQYLVTKDPKEEQPAGVVTYSYGVTELANKDFKLVEGNYVNPDTHKKVRGVEGLDTDLATVEAKETEERTTLYGSDVAAGAVPADVDAPKAALVKKVDALRSVVYGGGKDEDNKDIAEDEGLMDRTTDVENWINTAGPINPGQLIAVFDSTVFGKTDYSYISYAVSQPNDNADKDNGQVVIYKLADKNDPSKGYVKYDPKADTTLTDSDKYWRIPLTTKPVLPGTETTKP